MTKMEEAECSRIFCGHRALGYVSNHIPLVSRYIQKRRENLIATSVGKYFHTYGGAKLALLTVSGIHPEDISTLAGDTYMIYSAAGSTIYAWRRGSELKHSYKGHEDTVILLLPFGPHLISVDKSSQLMIFDIKSEKHILHLEFDCKNFQITTLCHPVTYENKILLGSSQGPLQLWNVKSGKRIYTFKGWNSKVNVLTPCPTVLDAVGIGLDSGEIIVHNLKKDVTFVKFKQDWGPVTCLAFRSDRNDLLISGSSEVFDEETGLGSGHIAIWNLNEKKLSGQMRNAHDSAITGMTAFPGEPLLVTSSPDNTIKEWIFDLPDGGGRLLKLREGHSLPPTKIRFYGALGKTILSAAKDSTLRSFSTETDLLNKSFGVASYNRKLAKKHKKLDNPVKMNPIIDFTSEISKETEWDNIACVHQATLVSTTWSFKKQKMGELKLRHPRFKENKELRGASATCCTLTMCGNFVLIGYDSGHIDKFNIQSGIHRGALGHPVAHSSAIKGIQTDGLNQIIVTGAEDQKQLRFWKFDSHKKMSEVEISHPLVCMQMHRESSLLALILANMSIQILDIMTHKVIRKLTQIHCDKLTDLTFSQDARWLITTSLDKTLKVWDVPSGTLIDVVTFATPVTSVTMSPTSDFLATTHQDDLGIYLWSNMSLYGHLNLKPLTTEDKPILIRMPTVYKSDSDDLCTELTEMDIDDDKEEEKDTVQLWRKSQIDDLVTLSGLPPARWQNLHNLDVIKARNKPKEAVQKPKNAPFFLPTITGPDGKTRFNLEDINGLDNDTSIKKPIVEMSMTKFGQALWDSRASLETSNVLETLKELGPSAIDIEIVALSPEGGGSVDLMDVFLKLLRVSLERQSDFEAVHAYLGLFLKHHSDAVMMHPELLKSVEELKPVMHQSWKDLSNDLTSAATLISFVKNSLLTSG